MKIKSIKNWMSKCTAFCSLLVSTWGTEAFSQTNIANYKLTKSIEPYVPITGGTVLVAANTPFDQQMSAAVTIPSFTFGGATITSCFVAANGYITFGVAPATTNYTPLSTSQTNSLGVIAGFAADLGYGVGNGTAGATSEIRYEQVGAEFVAQFNDVKRWNSTGERITFQIRLNTSNGQIKIQYANPTVIGSSTTALQVGIRGNSTTYATNVNNLYSLNVPAGNSCTWQDAVTGNSNSSTLFLSSVNTTLAPGNGLTFTWTPGTQLPVRTFAAVSGINTTSATINFTAPTGATQYKVRYRQTSACEWSLASGNPYTTNNITLTGLLPATTYQVQVQALSVSDSSIWSHIPNTAGTGDGYSVSGTFTTLPTCFTPTALTNNTVTNNGATVKWNSPNPLPQIGYEYYLSTSNTAPTASTPPTSQVTDTSVILTGLPSATQHYVWVRSNCGTNDKSNWTSSTSFTTLCGTPNPGATIATPNSNLCVGSQVAFTLTNLPTGPGLSYVWENSVDGTNFTAITGATAASYTGAVNAKFYRCRIVCSGGPDTVYSNPVSMNFATEVTAVSDGQRCGAGPVTLGATVNTGAVAKWYETETGGTAVGTGNPFITPTIGATTSFYVASEVVSTGNAVVGLGAITSNTYSNPFYSAWSNTHNQYLITAQDLQNAGLNAGNLTSLSMTTTSGTTTLQNFSLKIGHSSVVSMAGYVTTPLTQVFSAATLTPIVGVNTITFTTPFNWDGTSNIVLEICHGNPSSTVTVSNTMLADNTPYISTIHTHRTSSTNGNIVCDDTTTNKTTYSIRPRFTFGGQVSCASSRSVVTATINTAPTFTITNEKTVCNNAITPLTVTSSQSNFNQVIWTPTTDLYSDAAATVPYVANTHSYTVYHKSSTSGSSEYIATALNTSTQCGGIDTVVISVLPNVASVSASPDKLCVSGTGIVKINPVVNQQGAVYQWQSSTDNINFTNIGSNVDTLFTGNINTTTYYRTLIKNTDGTTCITSTVDTIVVNNPSITGTTPGSRCGVGTVNLAASGSTGHTVKWFEQATGGTELGSGNTFTTPVISTTTTFYASANAGASGTAVLGAGSYNSNSGTPTFSGTSPYAYHYGNYKHQMLVRASELTALGITAGSITSLGFEVATVGATIPNFNNFSITLIPTTNNVMTSTFVTGGTNVFSVPAYTPTTGINTHNFTTPFVWDGISNIIVQTCFNNNNNGAVTTSVEVKYDSTTFASHTILRLDGNQNTICTGTAGNSNNDGPVTTARPKMFFTANNVCESVRVPVIATVTPSPVFEITNNKTVCNNATTQLTVVTGNSDYNNVIWSPATNLFTNAAATTPYITGNHAAIVYHKSNTPGSITYQVIANNTSTQCSNFDSVVVQTLPPAITVTANPSTLCETGTAALTYSPAITQTNFSLQWGNSSDNINFTDISGANSASFTTPTTTNTTYYKLSVKNSEGITCISNTDTVVVLHPTINSVSGGQRCGPGSVTLNANGVDGTINWYTSATGGTAIGSGSTFNTPAIATTTDYFVAVENPANDTFSVGNGASTSSTYPNPFYSAWSNTHNQYLITAAELTAAGLQAGNITSLAIRINSGTTTMQAFSIKLAHTTATNMSAFLAPTFTTVYTAASQTPVVGVNTMNFTTPFNWDGTSNIVIEICHGNSASSATMSSVAVVDNTPYVSTIHTNVSASTAGAVSCANLTSNLTTYSIRPRFTFRNEYIGCKSPTRTQVTATINPAPNAGITPTASISLCDGDTTQLTASGVGSYQWLRNGVIIPNETSNTLNTTDAGTYRVVVSNSGGCSDTSISTLVLVNPRPVVDLGADTSICGNVVYTLDAANPGATYLWNDNSTAQTIDVSTPGQYSVEVVNTFNCTTNDTINILHLGYPSVDLGNDTSICVTQPLVLDAGASTNRFLWSTGDTTSSISVNQNGSYHVVVTNEFNCSSSDTINVNLLPLPINEGFDFLPLFDVEAGRIRFIPIYQDTNYVYLWEFGNGDTSTSMIAEHVYQTTGTYNVTLKINDGCSDSIRSLQIHVDRLTGVTHVNKKNVAVRLYPNPANASLKVSIEGNQTTIEKATIINALGQELQTMKLTNKSAFEIDLINYTSGFYFLRLETSDGILTRKFEIIK